MLVLVPTSSLPVEILSFLLALVVGVLLSIQLCSWVEVSKWMLVYGNLCHHNEEVSFFKSYLFDSIIIVGGFAFEDKFLRFDWVTFFNFDLLLKFEDLFEGIGTVIVGSASIPNISPFKFLMFTFI